MYDYELDIKVVEDIIRALDRKIVGFGSFFAKGTEDYSPEYYVHVALETPDKYKVYFTNCNFNGDPDYIISSAGTTVEKVYHDLFDEIPEDDERYMDYEDFRKFLYDVDELGNPENESNAEKYPTGFFLDEAVKGPKIKQKYSYAGPVFRFKDIYRNYWEDETEALSPQQALTNLTYKFKKKNGFIQNSDYTLDPDYLLCDDESIDVRTSTKDIKYCDNCGTRLNDGGTCPICDDGEGDY